MLEQKKLFVIIPILVAMVIFMEFLDISIINTAVPTIAREFMISPILLKFSVASYFLSLAIFIPISGWCTDKFGTKAIFISSVALFTASSLLCALAHNVVQLTIFRFLQGVGGAFMNPVSRIIVLRLFPPKELVKAQGFIFTPAMLGVVLGPFLGGVITEYLSWQWIFLINLPVGVIIIYFGSKYVEQIKTITKAFDWVGFVIAATSLVLVSFFVEMLNHYEIVSKSIVYSSGLIGGVLAIVLIFYCISRNGAVFDFSVFKIMPFNIGFRVNASLYSISASVAFLLPLMFQEDFNYSAAQSGLLILPIAIAQLVTRGLASTIINKFGFRSMLITGTSMLTLCAFLMGHIYKTSPLYYIIILEVMFGTAAILCGSCAGALNYVDTPKDKFSAATSLDMTFRQFLASIGIGITSFCLTSFAKLLNLNLFGAGSTKIFHYTFYVLGFIGTIAIINAFQLRKTATT